VPLLPPMWKNPGWSVDFQRLCRPALCLPAANPVKSKNSQAGSMTQWRSAGQPTFTDLDHRYSRKTAIGQIGKKKVAHEDRHSTSENMVGEIMTVN